MSTNTWTRERLGYGLFKAVSKLTGLVRYVVRMRVGGDGQICETFADLEEATAFRDRKMAERITVVTPGGKMRIVAQPTPRRDKLREEIMDWKPTHTPKRDRLKKSLEEWQAKNGSLSNHSP